MRIKYCPSLIRIPPFINDGIIKLPDILFIAVFLCLTVDVWGQQNTHISEHVELIKADSLINGYYLKNIDPLPFSPVVEPEFNLPDSALVNLYFTDTLYCDTLWILKEKLMSPGLYKIPAWYYGNYVGERNIHTAILHYEAACVIKDNILNRKESLFRVRYLLSLQK